MVPQRFIELIQKVEKKTKCGDLAWEATLEDKIFQVTLGSFILRIAEEPSQGGPDYRLSILDSQGRVIDSASNVEFGNTEVPSSFVPYFVLKEILDGARRSALGADKAIDSLLSDLDGGPQVVAAKYGAGDHFKDVARILIDRMVGGSLEILVNNENFGGDPAVGCEKELTVEFLHSGRRITRKVKEGETLILP